MTFTSTSEGTRKETDGNFQILYCTTTPSGPSVVVGLFSFNSKESESRWMWYKYKSSKISLFKSVQTAVLNMDVYKKIKEDIVTKLNGKIEEFIGYLQ